MANANGNSLPGEVPAGRPASNSALIRSGFSPVGLGAGNGFPFESTSSTTNVCFLFDWFQGTAIMKARALGCEADITFNPPPRT